MEIYLTKPGGQREGPYTLQRINEDLAAKKYRDTDYWAWYEGLEAWVPMHSIPGIIDNPVETVRAGDGAEPLAPAAEVDTAEYKAPPAKTAPTGAGAKQTQEPAKAPKEQLSSGMPLAALDQIIVFTSGEGPAAMRSPANARMLEGVIGAEIATIRERVPREVFGRCDVAERLAHEGKVPDSAWRALSAIKPEVMKGVRDGGYRTCVRTCRIETGDSVAVFLFYNKQKM